MSQPKPGKLKTNLFINLDAMKPGATNPLLAKKRRASQQKMFKRKNKRNNYYRDEYKQHPDDNTNVISAKLNQVTITKKRRKAKRKPKMFLLSDNTNTIDRTNHFNIKYVKTPPPPLPPPLPPSQSNKYLSISLIPNKKTTPFGPHNNDIDCTSPAPPHIPTPPPPPPPIENQNENRRNSAFIDVKKPPPVPSNIDLKNINKAARDTRSSTTFTVSGQKITIIGHARTGKTSLKNALFGRKFKEMTFPTVKAPQQPSIMVQPLRLMDGDNNNNDDDQYEINVQYQIYDTPGQLVLDYIPPLYITGSFCVFIVYDITDRFSYDRAKYWVNYLEENAKGYENVVLIGNKFDLHVTQRSITSEEVQIYAQKHDLFFIEMSVKTKHNFDLLLTWLNHKTQEKFQKEIAMEKECGTNYDQKRRQKGNKIDFIEQKNNYKQIKKQLLKQHRKNHKTIQLHKIDVHSRDKKGRACCLW